MKKVFVVIFSVLICSFCFAQEESSEQSEATNETPIENTIEVVNARIGLLNGPSCIPAAFLMESEQTLPEISFSYEKFATPQALLPKMLKKEIDIGFMPVNVAAKVYNSSGKAIVCGAVCGNGNLTLITKDSKILKIPDLEEKTVYVAGQGATPDFIFKYILSQYNLSNSVKLDFSIQTANIAAALISDKIEYAVVPEPFATIATIKDKSVRYAIDLQKEYSILSKAETYPLTCVVIRSDYAKKNPEAVQLFLQNLEKSVNWTNENPKKAGTLCEKYELGLTAGVVTNAIPKSNYVFVSAKEAQPQIEEMLKIFLENDENSIGNKLPEQDFYLSK